MFHSPTMQGSNTVSFETRNLCKHEVWDPWAECLFYKQGLIQMNILPRLRYILEVCSPAEPTVNDILDVLTRISQHSTQAANEVLKCPRLIETIFENFLPLSWKMLDQTGSVHVRPFNAAMRLVRGLCCAGKHMTASLVSMLVYAVIRQGDKNGNSNW